jgi:hypothetical protein
MIAGVLAENQTVHLWNKSLGPYSYAKPLGNKHRENLQKRQQDALIGG